jgi:hypothetical protein
MSFASFVVYDGKRQNGDQMKAIGSKNSNVSMLCVFCLLSSPHCRECEDWPHQVGKRPAERSMVHWRKESMMRLKFPQLMKAFVSDGGWGHLFQRQQLPENEVVLVDLGELGGM